MSQQLLDFLQFQPIGQLVGCKTMAQGMRGDGRFEVGLFGVRFDIRCFASEGQP